MSYNLPSSNSALQLRLQGVQSRHAPAEAEPARGAPNTVNHVADASLVFVQYNDERGAQKTAMYFRVGGQFYSTQDTTEWCKKLYPMPSWMQRQLEGRLKREDSATDESLVSAEDTVDVMGDLPSRG